MPKKQGRSGLLIGGCFRCKKPGPATDPLGLRRSPRTNSRKWSKWFFSNKLCRSKSAHRENSQAQKRPTRRAEPSRFTLGNRGGPLRVRWPAERTRERCGKRFFFWLRLCQFKSLKQERTQKHAGWVHSPCGERLARTINPGVWKPERLENRSNTYLTRPLKRYDLEWIQSIVQFAKSVWEVL